MVRATPRERNAVVARVHDVIARALQLDQRSHACDAFERIRRAATFSTRRSTESDAMVIVVMTGAKPATSTRKPRRILPSAEHRLRMSFPEVWAWYELIVAARGRTTPELEAQEYAPRRTSVRR
jgi:hypothetical protein